MNLPKKKMMGTIGKVLGAVIALWIIQKVAKDILKNEIKKGRWKPTYWESPYWYIRMRLNLL